ncbi:MAG: formylglycine-generating enzyme family protein [Phycisphaerae bacterium]
MALKLFTRRKSRTSGKPSHNGVGYIGPPGVHPNPYTDHHPAPRESFSDDPLKRLHQQGRHAVILRDEKRWREHHGGGAVVDAATAELEERMAFVPAGRVNISQALNDQPGAPEEETDIQPFLLDTHPVTNLRYQRFVDSGGYDELDYWPEDIWPHLIELKDQTDQPGPRFWRNGRHDERFATHPVVGVSWYEAQAYALWIGQRLASEAEWQMAASWHIKSSADIFRRFPWGDSMDNTRCNIWSSRHRGTVAVDEYPTGAAPNGVLQLIGNVWEWTDTDFSIVDEENQPIVGEMPMHVIRGASFDTYFETQATALFRTGQIALARSHNTGFRCAMDLEQATWMSGT